MTVITDIPRRTLLAGVAAGVAALIAAGTPRLAAAQAPVATGPRTATLDWAILETLLSLGSNVVAGPELLQFREVAVTPALPQGIADLGLRGTPNLEILRYAEPDIIFNSNFYSWADQQMQAIAPVESHAIYRQGDAPFELAAKVTLEIGERLGVSHAAGIVDAARAKIEASRRIFADGDGRPVLLINLGDPRHYRVFGADSMFGNVLNACGLTNAWTSATSYSAQATVGLETLASVPDAWIILIPPVPVDALPVLSGSAFWNALPAVRENRVIRIEPVNPYGGLPAATRFADQLVEGFARARNG